MLRTALVSAVLACIGACSPVQAPEQQASQASCLVMLRFESDEDRAAFLARNAQSIVAQASEGRFFATSSPATPEVAIFTNAPCSAFDDNQSGLDLQGATIVSASARAFEEAGIDLVSAFGRRRAWTDQVTNQCVVRIAPSGDRVGRLMNAMALGGLRNEAVSGDGTALMGAYDETCDLVRTHVHLALETSDIPTRVAAYCANASMRQCGYDGGGLASTPTKQ